MLRSTTGVPLLWGLWVLFATSMPETKSANVAIEANNATEQPTAASVTVLHVTVGNPERKPEDVGAAAPAVQIVSPIVANETSETTVSETTNGSDSSGDGSIVVTAVAAATSSSGLLASTEAPAGTSTRGEAKPSTNVTTATIETQPLATATVAMTSMTTATAVVQPSPAVNTTTGGPSAAISIALTETQPSATATVAMTSMTTAKAEVQPSPAVNTTTGGPSAAISIALTETQPSATATVAMTSMTTMAEVQPSPAVNTATDGLSAAVSMALTETQPSTVATMAKDQVQPSPSVTAATGEAPTLNFTMADTSNHTADQLRQSSTSSFINKTSASGATVAASSLQPTSTTGNTSALPSTTSLNTQSGSLFSHSVSLPTSSSPTSRTFTSTSTELSSTHRSVSTSVTLNSTAEPSETSSTTADSPSSTTGNSTSPAGILFPLRPKRLPGPTTIPAPAAIVTPCKPSKNPTNNQTTQPCSTRSMANHCLIIIASLAALATIFMVSTIVLCAKLSTRNYKVKKPQPATEMMCISALLPEETHTYRRQRNPVSNGVRVFPGGGYSDDEGGDNLTLSSFLPDNDCYV